MRRLRLSLAALALALPASATSQTPAPATPPAARPAPARLPTDSLERARKFTAWLYTNQTDSLYAYLDSPSERDKMKEAKGLEGTVTRLAAQGGVEEQLLEERWVTRNGHRQYWRKAKFSLMAEPLLVRWVMEPSGLIGGFGMGPASQAPPIDP